MNTAQQIAKHLREVYFGNNWTCSNLKSALEDVNFEDANKKMYNFNSIAVLVFHINYFVVAQLEALENGFLNAHDSLSFDTPVFTNNDEWKLHLNDVFANAEKLSNKLENLNDDILNQSFFDEKYGTYFRNFFGLIEHTHYHLGQIVILKKMIKGD